MSSIIVQHLANQQQRVSSAHSSHDVHAIHGHPSSSPSIPCCTRRTLDPVADTGRVLEYQQVLTPQKQVFPASAIQKSFQKEKKGEYDEYVGKKASQDTYAHYSSLPRSYWSPYRNVEYLPCNQSPFTFVELEIQTGLSTQLLDSTYSKVEQVVKKSRQRGPAVRLLLPPPRLCSSSLQVLTVLTTFYPTVTLLNLKGEAGHGHGSVRPRFTAVMLMTGI